MQVLIQAESVMELDEAVRVLNCAYPVLRGNLEVVEEIRNGRISMLIGGVD